MTEMMGFPATASGTLTSGGSMANMVGLTVARVGRRSLTLACALTDAGTGALLGRVELVHALARLDGLGRVDAIPQRLLAALGAGRGEGVEALPAAVVAEVAVAVEEEDQAAEEGADLGQEVGEDDNWVIHQPGGVVDLSEALLEAVVLDEPWPDYHGGSAAAPVWSPRRKISSN